MYICTVTVTNTNTIGNMWIPSYQSDKPTDEMPNDTN